MQLPKAHPPAFHRRKISLKTDSSYAASPKPSPRQKTIVPRLPIDAMQTLQKKNPKAWGGDLSRSTHIKSSAGKGHLSSRRHEPYKNLQYSQLTDRTASVSNGGHSVRTRDGENAPALKRRSHVALGLGKGASKIESADGVCKEERLENDRYEREISEAQRRKQQLLEELERLKFEVQNEVSGMQDDDGQWEGQDDGGAQAEEADGHAN
jgi:hypothetical protein